MTTEKQEINKLLQDFLGKIEKFGNEKELIKIFRKYSDELLFEWDIMINKIEQIMLAQINKVIK